MNKPEPFWDIRFPAIARRMYSEVPRGEADQFAAAVRLLRHGPNPPGGEQIGANLFQYRHNDYLVAFEIVDDAPHTVRITAFENITMSE